MTGHLSQLFLGLPETLWIGLTDGGGGGRDLNR